MLNNKIKKEYVTLINWKVVIQREFAELNHYRKKRAMFGEHAWESPYVVKAHKQALGIQKPLQEIGV